MFTRNGSSTIEEADTMPSSGLLGAPLFSTACVRSPATLLSVRRSRVTEPLWCLSHLPG